MGLDDPVTVTKVEQIGETRGFSGRVTRVCLDGAPAGSVVLKRPSADPAVRGLIRSFGLERRETHFYRHIAPDCPIRLPRILGVGEGSDGPVLVLEDLSAARPGDSHAGIAPDDAGPVFDEIARLHAHWWGRAVPGVPGLGDGPDVAAFHERCWPTFAQRFGSELPAPLLKAGRGAGVVLARARHRLAAEPATLLHGDLRLDNILFPDVGAPVFLDWQMVRRGAGAFDLAYLATGSLTSHRPDEMHRLVEGYRSALVAAGVIGYPTATAWRDYRVAMLFLFARTVTAGASLGFAEGVARERFSRALGRWVGAAAGCGALDALLQGRLPEDP
ncbi:MAG: phosphotransferase [Pseudomonadota bacterium]